MYFKISFSKIQLYLSLYLSANFRRVVILSPYQCAHRLSFPLPASSSWGVPCCSLAAPRLLPGLPHCSLACMAAPWLLLAVRLCLFLRGCAAAKRGLPKRSPPEAVLPRSGPLPMRCGLSDAPLSQRSSAVAVICRSGGLRKHAPAQRVLDGDRTTEIRLRVCLQTSA